MGVVSGEMGAGSWELEAGSLEWGDESGELGVGSGEMGGKRKRKREKWSVGSLDYYSFMNLNLLLRKPTYSSLYDLYV